MGKPFDAVLKAVFLAAVKVHLAKGWTVSSAYQQAKAEFQQEGKPVPDRAVVYRWLRQKGVFPRTGRTGRTSRTGRTARKMKRRSRKLTITRGSWKRCCVCIGGGRKRTWTRCATVCCRDCWRKVNK